MATLNPDDAAAIEKYMSDVLQIHTPAGQQPDPALIQFVQAELDAHHGATTGLDGFNVTQVGSTNDFMQLVKFAEAQAAFTGYAYMPTASQLNTMAKNAPPGGWDQMSASKAMFAMMPPDAQQKFPNAQFGMDNTNYTSMLGQYMDTWQNVTGNRVADMNLMKQAISEQWSQPRLTQFLMGNSWINNSAAPWTKYNMSFAQWTQYKVDHRQDIISRYGQGMGDSEQAYLANLANPQQKFAAQDAMTPAPTRPNYAQSTELATHASSSR